MKTKTFLVTLLLLLFIPGLRSVTAQTVNALFGDWKMEAPSAPPEYAASLVQISENSVVTSFSGDTVQYTSTVVKFDSDSLIFVINGLDARCTLKIKDTLKMTGKAVWPDGESTLSLTKAEKTE